MISSSDLYMGTLVQSKTNELAFGALHVVEGYLKLFPHVSGCVASPFTDYPRGYQSGFPCYLSLKFYCELT